MRIVDGTRMWIRVTALALLVGACSGRPAGGSAWIEGPPLGVARSEHPAVVAGGELVVIGGLVERRVGGVSVSRSVEAYRDGEWRVLPDLPEPRHHAAAAVVDDRVFVIGGFDESGFEPTVTVWELSGDSWLERSMLPAPVGAGSAVAIDGLIYVVGGVPEGGLTVYDPLDDMWRRLAAPTERREHLAVVALDGELWALGGRWAGDATASTEVFEPTTGTWRRGPEMQEARSGFGAAVLDGTIVIAGGERFDPLEALDSVEVLVDGGWMSAEPLPQPLHGNPLTVFDGLLHVPGGSDQPGGVENRGQLLILDD